MGKTGTGLILNSKIAPEVLSNTKRTSPSLSGKHRLILPLNVFIVPFLLWSEKDSGGVLSTKWAWGTPLEDLKRLPESRCTIQGGLMLSNSPLGDST